MSPTGILICCTVPSEAVPFVYLASVCWSLQCLTSSLSQAGGGGLLFWLLVPSRCGEGLALLSPSMLLRLLAALYGPCPALQAVPALGFSSADSAAPAFCAFPAREAQAARSLKAHSPRVRRAFSPPRSQPQFLPASRVRAPSPLRVPSPSPRRRRLGARALCLAATLPAISTIQNLRKSLVRNWRPVCSVVGDAVLGAEPAPFPSPLPPASGVAGPVCSRLAPLDLLGPFVL